MAGDRVQWPPVPSQEAQSAQLWSGRVRIPSPAQPGQLLRNSSSSRSAKIRWGREDLAPDGPPLETRLRPWTEEVTLAAWLGGWAGE